MSLEWQLEVVQTDCRSKNNAQHLPGSSVSSSSWDGCSMGFGKCFPENNISGLKTRDPFHLWTRRHKSQPFSPALMFIYLCFTFSHGKFVKHNRFGKCFPENNISGLKTRDRFPLWTRRHKSQPFPPALMIIYLRFTFSHGKFVKHNRFGNCFSENNISGLKNMNRFHLWTRRHKSQPFPPALMFIYLRFTF